MANQHKRADPDGKSAKVSHQKRLGQDDEGRPEPAPSGRAPSVGFVEQMPDMTLLQCCTSLNFWLLFLTCSIGDTPAPRPQGAAGSLRLPAEPPLQADTKPKLIFRV